MSKYEEAKERALRKFDWDEYWGLEKPKERKRYLKECYHIPKVRYHVWYVLPGDEKPSRAGKDDGFDSMKRVNEYLRELLPRLKDGRARCWISKEEVIEEIE